MEAIVTPASRLAFGQAADPSEAHRWMQEAVCAAGDPDLWFPSQGQTPDAAVELCSRCPVAGRCLEYAQGEGIDYGIYGGLTPAQRRQVRQDAA